MRRHTYHLLSHLLLRGVPVAHVVFERPIATGLRERIVGLAEAAYLRVRHQAFLPHQPATPFLFRQYGSVQSLLAAHRVGWSAVSDHNGADCVATLGRLRPDVLVLYGTRIIREPVLGLPSIGTLNVHSSLLPRYRGGKSEFWILLRGEPEAFGVSVHWVDPGLDTGPIFLQERIPVAAEDTPATLREKATQLGPVLLAEALRRIAQEDIVRRPQDAASASCFRAPTAADVAEFRRKWPGKPVF
jgi:methionyl-tRNA formyltransferase